MTLFGYCIFYDNFVGGGAEDDDDDDDDDEDDEDDDKGNKPVQNVVEQVPPPHSVEIEEHNDADDADEQFEVVVSSLCKLAERPVFAL